MQPNTKLEQKLLPLAEAAGKKIEMNALSNPEATTNGWQPKTKQDMFCFEHLAYRIAEPAPRALLVLATKHGLTLNMVRAIAAKAKWAREDAKSQLADGAVSVEGSILAITYSTDGSVKIGCQSISWEEIDLLGKSQSWWPR